ncbi:MAG: DUF459 domain-containing protein [Pseudomonadota bacterium]
MSGSALFRSSSALGFFRCAALALVSMAVAVTALSTGTSAQGLSHLSNSYVTPFPEQNRYRVYVFGDSLGDGLWAGLYRAFGPEQNVDVVKKSRVSTGFVRTDYFDWNKRLTRILAAEKVHIAVVMVGANDVQPIRVKSNNKKKR